MSMPKIVQCINFLRIRESFYKCEALTPSSLINQCVQCSPREQQKCSYRPRANYVCNCSATNLALEMHLSWSPHLRIPLQAQTRTYTHTYKHRRTPTHNHFNAPAVRSGYDAVDIKIYEHVLNINTFIIRNVKNVFQLIFLNGQISI